MNIITLLATFFYSGKSPKGPGTMGSLAALPFALLIHLTLGMEALCAATVFVFFFGWWVSDKYLILTGKDGDPQEIVIDEVAGMWLTLCLMPLLYMHPPMSLLPWLYGAAFIGFRLFDIWKPWPISVADRRLKGGFGIMLDDILAALFAVVLIGAIGHLLTGMGWITIDLGQAGQ